MKNLRKNRGITLIALVVTIIVLIILAGISVNLLIGDNGIITRAKDAAVAQEKADIIAKVRLDIAAKQVDKRGDNLTQDDLEDVLENYGDVKKENGEIISLTLEGKNYEIPLSDIYTGTLVVENEETSEFGLFDSEDNLVASWETLTTTYNLRVDIDYASSEQGPILHQENGNAMGYVLANNSELSTGTKLVIPNTITKIGDFSFVNCSSLTNITLPDTVTSIGDYAFALCSSLTSIDIPDSVTSIGDYAFAWCFSLTSIDIPDSVTSIGDASFVNCNSLTSIIIPDNITSIGSAAFSACGNLETVIIGNGVTNIGAQSFNSCRSLTSVTFTNTTGWTVNGNPMDVTNTSTNAINLSGVQYTQYDWIRTTN